jgi:hypothetical protein
MTTITMTKYNQEIYDKLTDLEKIRFENFLILRSFFIYFLGTLVCVSGFFGLNNLLSHNLYGAVSFLLIEIVLGIFLHQHMDKEKLMEGDVLQKLNKRRKIT